MKNWARAAQTRINTIQTNGNTVQTYINTVQTNGNKVETDCSPSLQTDETQPNEKI